MNKPVVASACDRDEAETMVGRLIDAGFQEADISVLFPQKAQQDVPAGGVADGIASRLVGLGITQSEARRLESEVREGKPLVSVQVESADERFRAEGVFADFSPADEITLRDSTVM